MIDYQHVDSPLGRLLLVADAHGLRGIEYEQPRHPLARGDDWREGDSGVLRATRAQLTQYFRGERRAFELPLAPQGTAFQRSVWQALLGVDYGSTASYADIARRLGVPNATRAVGAANGRNPISIVIPCHRVIGADGSLTGYGGGLQRKRALLALEGALAASDLFEA